MTIQVAEEQFRRSRFELIAEASDLCLAVGEVPQELEMSRGGGGRRGDRRRTERFSLATIERDPGGDVAAWVYTRPYTTERVVIIND